MRAYFKNWHTVHGNESLAFRTDTEWMVPIKSKKTLSAAIFVGFEKNKVLVNMDVLKIA